MAKKLETDVTPDIREQRLFGLYGQLLSAIDWARDMRKQRTICTDCLKLSRLALEVFETETQK